MLKIGLTGGIGGGKSTVAACFEALGIPVIDADSIARQLVKPGLPAYREIVRVFGPGIVEKNKQIDRVRLRRIVFGNQADRKRLESILHPAIRSEIHTQVARLNAPYCILMIPLLIETQQQNMVDRILVVDADESDRFKWLSAREGLSEAQIRQIMSVQVSRTVRLDAADDCIVNDGRKEKLITKVAQLDKRYRALSEATVD